MSVRESNLVVPERPNNRLSEAKYRRQIWINRLLRNQRAIIGIGIVLFFVLLSVLAPILSPGDPSNFVDRGNLPPSLEHPLGTMAFGQDVLAQIMWGGRTSLTIGFAAGIAATLLSVIIGMAAGYFEGAAGEALSMLINVFLVMPGLPLAVVLAAYLPPGPVAIIAVLSISGWAWGARVFRAQTLSLREKDFVAAAIVSGESSVRIIFREILPNMTSLIVANVIGATTYGIGAEVGLSFLGLGNISTVSWGSILYWARSTGALVREAYWMFAPAGLCVALIGFALTMINYALDEVTNPRLRNDLELSNYVKKRIQLNSRATPILDESR